MLTHYTWILLFLLQQVVLSAVTIPNGNFCTSYNLFIMTIDIQVKVDAATSSFAFRGGIKGGLQVPSTGMCVGNQFQLDSSSGTTEVTPARCLVNIMSDYSISNLAVRVKSSKKIQISAAVPMFGTLAVDLVPCLDAPEEWDDEL